MPKKYLRIAESGEPQSANERTQERLGASGAVEGKKSKDGSYLIRVITEGKGSSGVYPARTLEEYFDAFDGVKSFFDHPDWAPEERSVLSLAGRLVPDTAYVGKTEEGLTAVYSRFKPREEYRSFFEEFSDTLGFSIYARATFSEADDGTRIVESFDRHDPYRSVDVVVAAGRGGRFEQASESLKELKTSLTEGNKPDAEASAKEKEGNMLTKEDVQAIIVEALKPLAADVAELKEARTQEAKAEATAEAIDTAVTEALASYDEKVTAVTAEKDLLKSQREALLKAAREGKDITEDLDNAKALAAEAKETFIEKPEPAGDAPGVTFEGAGDLSDEDYLARIIEGAK